MQTLKLFLLSWSLLLIAACSNEETISQAPIAPEKMQAILLDIHTAEYYSQGLGKHDGTFLKEHDSLAQFYTTILQHHQIDLAQFKSALDWYTQHPLLLDSVYVNVKDAATAMQQDVTEKINKGQIIPRSTVNQGRGADSRNPFNQQNANKDSAANNNLPKQAEEQ